MIATVVVNSLSTRWLGTWLPPGYTTRWYYSAWREFQLDEVLVVTFQIAGAVALLSALLGVPAAYALARPGLSGQEAGHAAVPAAASRAPLHVRHPAGNRPLQSGAGRHDVGRDRRQPGADLCRS
jgi:hypothetical protein